MRRVLNLPYVTPLLVFTSDHAEAAPSYETATKYVKTWRGRAAFYFMLVDAENIGVCLSDRHHGMDEYLLASLESLTYVAAFSKANNA